MKATPGPSVSGRYFLPKAPVWWVKVIPADLVTSVNWIEGGPVWARLAIADRNSAAAVRRKNVATAEGAAEQNSASLRGGRGRPRRLKPAPTEDAAQGMCLISKPPKRARVSPAARCYLPDG